jgi:uncharacterized protein YoxC
LLHPVHCCEILTDISFYSDDIHNNIGDVSSRLEVLEKETVNIKQSTNDLRTDLKPGFQDINFKIDRLQGLIKDMAADQQK